MIDRRRKREIRGIKKVNEESEKRKEDDERKTEEK